MIKGLECLSYEKREEVVGKRQLRGDPILVYKYLKGGWQENGARLFLVVPVNRTKDNKQKLMASKFHLNMRKKFFTVHCLCIGTDCPEKLWSFSHWRYPRTIWMQLCAMCSRTTLLAQAGLDKITHCGPFKPTHSIIL